MPVDLEERPTEITYSHGKAFRDPENRVNIIVDPNFRPGKTETFNPQSDIITSPHNIPENEEQTIENRKHTARLAKDLLKEFKEGNTRAIGTGVEIEGVLYDKNGNILAVHKGPVTFDDAPPELYDGQLEIVTKKVGKDEHKVYPSSALQVADAVSDSVGRALHIAELRDGQLVFSSVPEGGSPEQLRVTQHKKILTARDRSGVYAGAPEKVKELATKVGLDEILPFHGTHVHTSDPQLPNGKFDIEAAYAVGVISLTQMAQNESFMLFNTRHYMGKPLEDIKDVRSVMKRASIGAQETTIADNPNKLVNEAISAVEEGGTHQISRYPMTGQYDRRRFFKEFGTSESVVGSANPDLRLIMAHTYYEQLMRVLSYKALAATEGDSSKVISYLQNDFEGGKYGYLFEQLPTMEGENSNFQQDLTFNKNGFGARGHNSKTYEEQIEDMREIARKLGDEFSAFRIQAKVVDHVFGKMIEPPQEGGTVEEYMDIDSGMKGGILTDYKSDNIAENIRMQAEGTKEQQKSLSKVKNERDLLKFFGIEIASHKRKSVLHRTLSKIFH